MQRLNFAPTVSLILLAGCASFGEVPIAKLASVALTHANGVPAGTAVLTAAGDKVTLSMVVTGLPEGQHGTHLHMVGKCEAPGFTSAGGHLNPASRQHGSHNPAGSHLGDLPNVVIDSSGKGTLVVELGATRSEAEAALFDADGTALMIHAASDDYTTDPTGNSGARVVCGVLKRS